MVIVFVVVIVYVYMYMSQHTCGSQRSTMRNQISLSTVRWFGEQTQVARLSWQVPLPMSHLAGTTLYFWMYRTVSSFGDLGLDKHTMKIQAISIKSKTSILCVSFQRILPPIPHCWQSLKGTSFKCLFAVSPARLVYSFRTF